MSAGHKRGNRADEKEGFDSSAAELGKWLRIRSAGKALSARYVMEGSLRQAGTRLRIALQVVDTSSGVHLWAETYDRSFSPETVFELQDDVVPRIVSTVADSHGVLPHSMSEAVQNYVLPSSRVGALKKYCASWRPRPRSTLLPLPKIPCKG
jgi:hypothetical protein